MVTDIIDLIKLGIVEIQDRNKKTKGTGFFVTSDGYILTAYHVIQNLKPPQIIKIETHDQVLDVELIEDISDQALDFAVLRVKDEEVKEKCNFSCLPLGTNVYNGDPWCTLGFEIYNHFHGVPNGGILQGYAELSDNRDFRDIILTSENPIMEGTSGSPIFNKKFNNVVGVIKEEMKYYQGHAVSFETIFNKWPELKQLNLESKNRIFFDSSRVFQNVSKIDNVVELVAKNLKNLDANEKIRNEIIRRIVDIHNRKENTSKIEISPESNDSDLCVLLAKEMLRLGLFSSSPILEKLCQKELNPSNLKSIFHLLEPSWVDFSAVECISKCDLHTDYYKPVALNAFRPWSAEMYVRRASCSPRKYWPIVHYSGVFGAKLEKIFEEIEDLLLLSICEIQTNGISREKKRDLIKMMRKSLKRNNKPIFISLEYSPQVVKLLPAIQKDFPNVTFFLLTGEEILNATDFELDCKILSPLTSNVEDQAYNEMCEVRLSLMASKCFGFDHKKQ